MMLITDSRPGEKNLITGLEMTPLEIRGLNGVTLTAISPNQPWTHELLVRAVRAHQSLIDEAYGADAYLGEQFIGSTEL